jgi:DNA-directed RNA polymerase subunit RPC12/RpoP
MNSLFYEASYRCSACNKITNIKSLSNPPGPMRHDCKHCSSRTSKVYERFFEDGRYDVNIFREPLTHIEKRYRTYWRSAESRALPFELSYDDFEGIVKEQCHYCLLPPTKVEMGVDRKDNKLGYLKSNCLPACKWCNMAKGKMTYTAFLKQSNKRNGV